MSYPGEPLSDALASFAGQAGDHSTIFDVGAEDDPQHFRKPKYRVFKEEDWQRFLQEMGQSFVHACAVLRDSAIDDAVVLRKKDIWTADTLDFYARAISRFVAAVRKANGSSGVNDRFLNEQQAIADYFREEADDAQANFDVKFPD